MFVPTASVIQSWIELRPDLILLGARHVAISTFQLGFQFCGGRFRLMVIEIEITPAAGIGVALAILDRHIGTVQGTRDKSPARRLGSRAIRILCREGELKLLEKDGSFRKY